MLSAHRKPRLAKPRLGLKGPIAVAARKSTTPELPPEDWRVDACIYVSDFISLREGLARVGSAPCPPRWLRFLQPRETGPSTSDC